MESVCLPDDKVRELETILEKIFLCCTDWIMAEDQALWFFRNRILSAKKRLLITWLFDLRYSYCADEIGLVERICGMLFQDLSRWTSYRWNVPSMSLLLCVFGMHLFDEDWYYGHRLQRELQGVDLDQWFVCLDNVA